MPPKRIGAREAARRAVGKGSAFEKAPQARFKHAVIGQKRPAASSALASRTRGLQIREKTLGVEARSQNSTNRHA
eukprot:6180540-Pleurochrysis_carterae.AAC.3